MTVRAAILGASGYAGGEVLRLLLAHPEAQAVSVVSRTNAGKAVGAVQPHLARLTDLVYAAQLPPNGFDVVFLAGAHGFALGAAPPLLDRGVSIVDLSADFRLSDAAAFQRFYGDPPEGFARQREFVYGLPELFREKIRGAKAVASPGCFATASILALAPLWKAGLVEKDARPAVFAVTGSSGAGISPSPTTHHPRRSAAFFAYSLDGHRHLPEIEQALTWVGAPAQGRVVFQTHSSPLVRGIFATASVPLETPLDTAGLRGVYEETYGSEFFVRIVEGSPDVAAVRGTNFADVGVAADGGDAKVFVALDNLVKGAAGQAIQAMNLMFGLDETAGLRLSGVFP